MPKMTHWRNPEPVDVPAEKVAVYQGQGWVAAERGSGPSVTAVTKSSVDEPAPAKKAAAKKTTAKKTAAKKK